MRRGLVWLLVLGVLVLLTLAVWALPLQVGDARSAAVRVECGNRMHAMALALHEYMVTHGDVPRRPDGRFSPELLLGNMQTHQHFDVAQTVCTLADSPERPFDGLRWVDDVTPEEVHMMAPDGWHPRPFVLLTHDPESPHVVNSRTIYQVLFSDGTMLPLNIPPSDYRVWFDTVFVSGERELPPGAAQYVAEPPMGRSEPAGANEQ